MKKATFLRLPEFDDEKETRILKMNEFFLYGKSMIGQKQNKTVGNSISYYQVIGKTNLGIEYAPIFDYMESD